MESNNLSGLKISLLLNSNKKFIVKDDILKVKAVIENKGNIQIGNCSDGELKLFSRIPKEIKFIEDTIKINRINLKNSSITKGINLKPLKAGEKIELEFEVIVVGEDIKDIKFNLISTYGYVINDEVFYDTTESNFINLKLEVVKVDMRKKYSKQTLCLNDEVESEVEIINIGSVDMVNIIYKDDIGGVLHLIEDSFSINGEIFSNINIQEGVYIGNLPVGEKFFIKYKLKLVTSTYKSQIESKGRIEYLFLLPNKILGGERKSNFNEKSNVFYLNISNFKQLNIENSLTISEGNKLIQDINRIDVNIEITNSYVIETIKDKSYEGQYLSGYKLIVNGKINEVIEYTSCGQEAMVHSENFSYPFSTFIVLAEDFNIGTKIEVESIVENINYKMINNKSFYQDILLLLWAKIYN